MPEHLGLHICFNELGLEIEILDVTPVGQNTYRIEETPIFNPSVSLGDIIRVKEEQGIYYYIETVQKSQFKRYAWLLSKEAVSSRELAAFRQRITDHEGRWEQILGGLFIVNMPKNSGIDIEAEMIEIISRFEEPH